MASALPASLSLYGATVTRTFTTTYNATPNELSYTILYPPASVIGSLQFTVVPPYSPNQIAPSPPPTLTLTDVVGIAYSNNGVPLMTATLAQGAAHSTPTYVTVVPSASSTVVVTTGGSCVDWSCWGQGKQGGFIACVIILLVALIIGLWWIFQVRPNILGRWGKAKPSDDEELGIPGLDIVPRRRRRRSSDSGTVTEQVIRNSRTMEVVPEGTMTVPAYRVYHSSSGSSSDPRVGEPIVNGGLDRISRHSKSSSSSGSSRGSIKKRSSTYIGELHPYRSIYTNTPAPPVPDDVSVKDWAYDAAVAGEIGGIEAVPGSNVWKGSIGYRKPKGRRTSQHCAEARKSVSGVLVTKPVNPSACVIN
ncbi:uncharacterized protein LY89DRAFT_731779 [Mollisia scopiformis]|uniref:Uncharacterized protein n=1 Tax=Mollisia scopiformis TaxID=149040 RepID=A0A194XGQ3_MOLSC|nr:uncharacterized protein LY89DRAFT_731779 [Mollisia scopiformis]KUJ19380.1 hypothetical protein LY89DRAFT_731779 [Mollisia scopiformis]